MSIIGKKKKKCWKEKIGEIKSKIDPSLGRSAWYFKAIGSGKAGKALALPVFSSICTIFILTHARPEEQIDALKGTCTNKYVTVLRVNHGVVWSCFEKVRLKVTFHTNPVIFASQSDRLERSRLFAVLFNLGGLRGKHVLV